MTIGQKLRFIGAVMIIVGFMMLLTSYFGFIFLGIAFASFMVIGFCIMEDLF